MEYAKVAPKVTKKQHSDIIQALLAPTSLVHASLSDRTSSFPLMQQILPMVKNEYADKVPKETIKAVAGTKLSWSQNKIKTMKEKIEIMSVFCNAVKYL
jgi:hypothetical protein